jgi:transcriptional regulator with PAS, ATPase and Fis domain
MQSLDGILPLLEAIGSHIDEGILISDRAGNVLFVNPSAKAILAGHHEEQSKSAVNGDATRTIAASRNGHVFGFHNISNITRLDLVGIMREAFYGIENGQLKTLNTDLKKFHREIKDAGGHRQIEIKCCMTCEQRGNLRLFILRDITKERKLAAFLERASSDLITNDPKMIDILRRVDQVAPEQASILLQGESGTGKTHIARLIHRISDRGAHPFVELNCAAIPETLLESELFGHVKGAFTGAHQNRKGRFQAANGGTLFLDEIGEIPLHLQAKLLRAIQDKQFEPVGTDRSIKVDVRIISSSNQDLRGLVDSGSFRGDLYYRLAVIPLHIPPVRERPSDIPLLLQYFCENISARGNPAGVECSPEAMKMLMDYPWPGNVRELENAVEHAVICARNGVVVPESLPSDIRNYRSGAVRINQEILKFREESEQQASEIRNALKKARGNKSAAAELLGINRSTLWRRMQRLSIDG